MHSFLQLLADAASTILQYWYSFLFRLQLWRIPAAILFKPPLGQTVSVGLDQSIIHGSLLLHSSYVFVDIYYLLTREALASRYKRARLDSVNATCAAELGKCNMLDRTWWMQYALPGFANLQFAHVDAICLCDQRDLGLDLWMQNAFVVSQTWWMRHAVVPDQTLRMQHALVVSRLCICNLPWCSVGLKECNMACQTSLYI